MNFEYYQAITDEGGSIGNLIQSGVVGSLLDGFSEQDQIDGITMIRKIYVKNTDPSGDAFFTLDSIGLFNATIFPSSGDAQVVGDITGTEPKFGAGLITGLEDRFGTAETTNYSGGLIDIKKIKVQKNADYIFFRADDSVNVGRVVATIETVVDLGSEFELTFVNPIRYEPVIGKAGCSCISANIAQDAHVSYWIEIFVAVGSNEPLKFNEVDFVSIIK